MNCSCVTKWFSTGTINQYISLRKLKIESRQIDIHKVKVIGIMKVRKRHCRLQEKTLQASGKDFEGSRKRKEKTNLNYGTKYLKKRRNYIHIACKKNL